jgi:HEAT repeat protein
VFLALCLCSPDAFSAEPAASSKPSPRAVNCSSVVSSDPAKRDAEIRRLTAILNDGTEEERSVAADRLACFGSLAEPAVPAMINLFAAGNGEVQANAVEAVAAVGYSSVAHLISATEHPDPRIRVNACQALGRMGAIAREALPALAKLLDSPATAGNAEIAMRRILCGAEGR